MEPILLITALLLWINFLPPFARLLFGDRFNRPVDGGLSFVDGRPLFGSHKTRRGLVSGIVGSLLFAPFFPVPWYHLPVAAALALAGDLLSSFLKRRSGLPPGKNIFLLDQGFEGLLPSLYLARVLDLPLTAAAAAAALFVLVAWPGSALWAYLSYQPDTTNFLRLVRSSARVRQWRACHTPLARWHRLLNFENVLYYRIVMTWLFRLFGLYRRGRCNALQVELREEDFRFASLPQSFDGYRILLLTDLHLDGLPELTDRLIEQIDGLEVDLCLLAGDYRMEMYGPLAPAMRLLERLIARVRSRDGVFGVLGNHDCIEMVPDLEDAGIVMLINDAVAIERQGERIWIVGIDDPHFYKVHDPAAAYRDVPPGAFSIFLAHSPEAVRDVLPHRPDLYLCGHTHGGQVCLPGGGKIFTHCRAPRAITSGRWQFEGMTGYTSRGAGASGLPLRFHCPGEITLITLRRG
ncbi:MAG: CDP-archaeol synthase [Thermodesulfobacteriota bacterium]